MSLTELIKKLASCFVLLSKQYIYKLPIEVALRCNIPEPEGLKVVRISPENVARIRDWKGARYVRQFKRYLNRGDLGLFLIKNDQIISYCWAKVKLKPYSLACLQDPIAVNETLLHRGEVRQEFRGKGIATYHWFKLLELVCEQYWDKELKQICGAIVQENSISQHIHEKLGFTKGSELKVLVLFRVCFFSWERYLTNNTEDRATRFRIRLKLPEIFWDPAFNNIRARFASLAREALIEFGHPK